MGANIVITNSVICMTLVLFACSPFAVNGFEYCTSSIFEISITCDDGYYCCGVNNNKCCKTIFPPDNPGPSGRNQEQVMELVATLIMLMTITCCCICCYRCCCRRTTSRGFVYSTPGTTTAVSVTLPPSQQQVPYPTVVPYPQQTPYPPQYNPPTNPYYGMPPPAYGVAVQCENQQNCSPSAPYIQS